jgi:hypothetical protein
MSMRVFLLINREKVYSDWYWSDTLEYIPDILEMYLF